MARIVSLIVLTLLIVFLGITFFKVVAPFLLPLFLAGVLALLSQPMFRYFVRVTGDRIRLAAGLTTVAILIGLMLPLLVGIIVAAWEIQWVAEEQLKAAEKELDSVQAQSSAPVETGDEAGTPKPKDLTLAEMLKVLRQKFDLETMLRNVEDRLPHPIDEKAVAEKIRTNVRSGLTILAQRTLGVAGGAALGMVGTTASAFISLLIFVIALYYFLADGPALLASAESLIPVHVHYQRELLAQFNQVVRAVALATVLASIVQGLLTAAAMYVVGFSHFFTVFVVAALASMIPLAGTWMVWGPCAVWLAYEGHYLHAGFLTVVGVFVVGLADNAVRTYVLNTDAKLHPLLAFVSVLGGLQMMGLWGIFIGPIVAACLYALVVIFNAELKELSRDRFAVSPGGIRPVVGPTPGATTAGWRSIEGDPLRHTPTPDDTANSGAGRNVADLGRETSKHPSTAAAKTGTAAKRRKRRKK